MTMKNLLLLFLLIISLQATSQAFFIIDSSYSRNIFSTGTSKFSLTVSGTSVYYGIQPSTGDKITNTSLQYIIDAGRKWVIDNNLEQNSLDGSPLFSNAASTKYDQKNAMRSSINLRNANLFEGTPILITTESNEDVQNQLNITQQRFFRTDQSLWLEQFSGSGVTGKTGILLHTLTETIDQNAIIAIQDNAANKFGLMLTGNSGAIGWEDGVNKQLVINASEITTNGTLHSSNFILSNRGLVVSDQLLVTSENPEFMQGYFFSKEKQSGLLISNVSDELNALAGLYIKQGKVTNFIGTTSSKTSTQSFFGGSFLMESNSPNGIVFNAKSFNNGDNHTDAISFASNNFVFARLGWDGSFNIGPGAMNSSAAFSVRSNNKGVILPKMKSREIRNIINPEEGLIVYDLDLHKYCFYTPKGWVAFRTDKINL